MGGSVPAGDLLNDDPAEVFDLSATIAEKATKRTVVATAGSQLTLYLEEHESQVSALVAERRRKIHRRFDLAYRAALVV